MNDPVNLKNFIRMIGIPVQPYRIFMHEIGNTILRKVLCEFHTNFTDEFKRIKQQVRCLKRQLIDNKITPKLDYKGNDPLSRDAADSIMNKTVNAIKEKM